MHRMRPYSYQLCIIQFHILSLTWKLTAPQQYYYYDYYDYYNDFYYYYYNDYYDFVMNIIMIIIL